MNTILIVEDDLNLQQLYQSILQQENYTVFVAENGLNALKILEIQTIDLIITDIMMPELDGFEFTHYLRQQHNELPILMITAKTAFLDKKKGFKVGVDDYMIKPINNEEMILRVEALLRRANLLKKTELTIGETTLHQENLTVSKKRGAVIELPNKEFLLLQKLIMSSNQIFTRQQLMNAIWGPDSDSEERTIDVHIKRLRTKFKNNPDFKILTIRGLGYKVVLTHD
ncbi:response regulator transcription factor [Vagococcus sp.]|uniref:response regulator transcription factor n=1 Tax=Vagococcus sp. TaxID=1933889 RepID=UPI003F983D5E